MQLSLVSMRKLRPSELNDLPQKRLEHMWFNLHHDFLLFTSLWLVSKACITETFCCCKESIIAAYSWEDLSGVVYNSSFFQVNNLRILDDIVKTFLSNGNYNFHRLELRKQRNMDEKGKEEN